MKQILLLLTILSLSAGNVFSQGKQGNNWYFVDHAGMTFNYGDPPQLLYGGQIPQINEGVTSMSDEDGNLLFYGNGNTIWNREHDTMLNGNNVGNPTARYAHQIMAIPVPGSSHLYYYLTFDKYSFQYSTINMNMDNGKGGVNPFTKCTHICNALSSVTAVHHKNQTDIWLVIHKSGGTTWNSYKVTAEGIESPVICNAGSNYPTALGNAYIKLSPDGTKLAATVYTGNWWVNPNYCEIYDFDSESGHISDDNITHIGYPSDSISPMFLEFSPNSSLLYVKKYWSLYQYNINAGTPQQIIMSEVSVPITAGWGVPQLAPDGKIYFPRGQEYMSVIHNPNEVGLGCNYESSYIYFRDNWDFYHLPYILPSFLREYEFESNQYCSGEPTQFNIVSTNGIDSVYWKFSDFANFSHDTSTLLNPSYTYSGPGTYYPRLIIYSGNWPPKVLIDTITIIASPEPDLGNDTSFCANETISMELDAGEGQFYRWNDVAGGTQILPVNAPGTYWVEVTDKNCIGRDTISIIQYSAPVVDISNSIITKANCGDSVGSITGILVTGEEPGYQWKASDGSIVSDSLDLTNMPAGIYSLYITYGSNCSIDSISFEIGSTDGPQITGVLPYPDYCNLGNGQLTVDAVTNTGESLMYSLDGTNFSPSNIFMGLPEDTYTVTVKDVNGCTDAFITEVENFGGPIVIDSIATDENGFNANGSITIMAVGDSLYYALIGIDIPQASATFTGLSADDYIVSIKDKWGCERLVYLTIERINGIVLSASAGDDYKCKKETAYSTLTADNFINVMEYKAVLTYNNLILHCTGYNPAPGFADVTVTDYNGSVEVEWQSDVPVTLPGTVSLTDLVFEATTWGDADIKWDTAWSVFRDGYGYIIASSLNPGVITINDPPLLQNSSLKSEFCEGEQALIAFNYTGGTDPVNIQWQIPDNTNVSGLIYEIDSIKLTQAGNYTIHASDANNCKDTLRIPVAVYAKPTSGFETIDTIYYEQTFLLETTPGYFSYEWNTGDTSYFITGTEEGNYSVIIKTQEGCTTIDSAYLKDVYLTFYFNVPNAFTPDGDGLNDVFRPVADYDRFSKFSMVIYNSWGQRQFETTKPAVGWDGKGAAAGVYVWVITYADYLGKVATLRGSVTVVR